MDVTKFAAVALVQDVESRDGEYNRVVTGDLRVADLPIPVLNSHDHEKVIGRVDKFYRLSEASELVAARALLESPAIGFYDPDKVWLAEGVLMDEDVSKFVEARMMRGVSVGGGQLNVAEGEIENYKGESVECLELRDMQVVELSFCSVAAIGDAVAWLQDSEFSSIPEREEVLAAFNMSEGLNGAPVRPLERWFEYPNFDWDPGNVGGCHVSEGEEFGRFIGYLGFFDAPHQAYNDRLVYMPREARHDFFLNKHVLTAEGSKVSTGVITWHDGHTPSGGDVERHHENPNLAVADVNIIGDDKGYLMVGAVRPDVPSTVLRRIRGSNISGEWLPEPKRNKLRLRIATAVNAPGYVEKVDNRFGAGETVKGIFTVKSGVDSDFKKQIISKVINF